MENDKETNEQSRERVIRDYYSHYLPEDVLTALAQLLASADYLRERTEEIYRSGNRESLGDFALALGVSCDMPGITGRTHQDTIAFGVTYALGSTIGRIARNHESLAQVAVMQMIRNRTENEG